nr:SPASM domain-containing protein [uncultured Lachnoclostridium sp.]
MKACSQPWKQLHIHNNGGVWFCCMKPSRTQRIQFD